MAVKCIFCGGPADPGWETCSSCDIEQAQIQDQEDAYERELEEEYARDFDARVFAEQDELAYLDKALFGGH